MKFGERLGEAGIAVSVGSVGDSYDNALAETINGLYKAERSHINELPDLPGRFALVRRFAFRGAP